ncbi:peptidoglycan-binding protein [Streptomyces sp. NPDC047821]|uniref:peptidoglycan-binding protein n=1 Tax=unclassified Streptomyces TaxID=2593676 RepID=UPI00363DFE96
METEGKYYTVKTGDTLYAIARTFGTTVEQLQAWNNIPNPNIIKIGQRLIVSQEAPQPGAQFVPFPGAAWFKTQPNSPIIAMMGARLIEERCSAYGPGGPSAQWNQQHRDSYAMWQRKLGFRGADADGWPGETSWTKLRVPYQVFA